MMKIINNKIIIIYYLFNIKKNIYIYIYKYI